LDLKKIYLVWFFRSVWLPELLHVQLSAERLYSGLTAHERSVTA
jgi:hypothetical protein